MNGQLFDNGCVESLVIGALPVCPPLNICLRPTPLRELQIQPRWAPLCKEDTVIQYYGTLRRISATHASSGALTERNKHELPQCLYFDADFRTDWAARRHRELPMRMVVAPRFAEWLMGVPAGWTSVEPLEAAVRHKHIAFCETLLRLPKRLSTLSLFSGCGVLDLALLPWCAPVGYCEICPTVTELLKARMRDGSLPSGPVFDDVRLLTRAAFLEQLPRQARSPGVQGPEASLGLVYGFPCTNTSVAGLRAGIVDGQDSSLVYEAIRVADEVSADWMFIENVSGIRSADRSDVRLVEAVRERGFKCRWAMLRACDAGSPQRRRRWFMLAWRGHFNPAMLMPPQLSLKQRIEAERGIEFNSGRPGPPATWMVDMADYPQAKRALEMLGNSVVPHQAILAASILAT